MLASVCMNGCFFLQGRVAPGADSDASSLYYIQANTVHHTAASLVARYFHKSVNTCNVSTLRPVNVLVKAIIESCKSSANLP